MKNSKNNSRSILREALTKNVAFDHIDFTHSKFLSENIVNSVL